MGTGWSQPFLPNERLIALTTTWPHITVTCPCSPRTLCHVKVDSLSSIYRGATCNSLVQAWSNDIVVLMILLPAAVTDVVMLMSVDIQVWAACSESISGSQTARVPCKHVYLVSQVQLYLGRLLHVELMKLSVPLSTKSFLIWTKFAV